MMNSLTVETALWMGKPVMEMTIEELREALIQSSRQYAGALDQWEHSIHVLSSVRRAR